MPSHNCIIIITMFSFQGTCFECQIQNAKRKMILVFNLSFFFKRLNETIEFLHLLQSISLLCTLHFAFFEVVGQNGLEPSTSRLSVVCSSQLSYWPILDSLHFLMLVEISGIEPLTSCLQGRRSPSWAKPPYPFSTSLGTFFPVPSKLNNVKLFNTLYWP